MQKSSLVGIIVLAIVVSLITTLLVGHSSSNSANQTSLKSKVLAAGVIKVGYVIYPPGLIKDPNTGKLSGIFYDALNEAGKNLGVKVEWTEEVGWGSMIEGLKAGRYDMIGSPVWPSSARATQADFTLPITYSVIDTYARVGDNRFDASFDAINSADVRISVIDGELPQTIAADQFPKAKVVSLSQLSSESDSLLNVATGKADVVFVEPYIADAFMKSNPGKIKDVQPGNPIRINGNGMLVPEGQDAFKSMLNVALQEELNSGYIDTLVKKYETNPNSFYPIAKPFALPQ